VPPDAHTFRPELVGLLRGFFACPVLVSLTELGMTSRMRAGPFTAAEFPQVRNPANLRAALRYLQSLGLLESAGSERFRLTAAGEYIVCVRRTTSCRVDVSEKTATARGGLMTPQTVGHQRPSLSLPLRRYLDGQAPPFLVILPAQEG
jgi:hypothetical protein